MPFGQVWGGTTDILIYDPNAHKSVVNRLFQLLIFLSAFLYHFILHFFLFLVIQCHLVAAQYLFNPIKKKNSN